MPFYNLQRNLFLGGKRYRRRNNPVFIGDDEVALVPSSAVMVEEPKQFSRPSAETPSLRDYDMSRKQGEAMQRIEAAIVQNEGESDVDRARRKFKK